MACRQRRVHLRAAEQEGMELRREAPRLAPAQQLEARDVLVDLRLHLEREPRHRPVVPGVVRDAEEVADAFERGPAVGEVVRVKAVARVVPVEPLQQCGIEVERQAELIAGRGDEKLLLARCVSPLAGQLRPVSDEKVFDATSDIEVVDSGQQGFEPFEGPRGHGGSMRERAGCDRPDAELHEQAVRARAAGLVPDLVEAQHVARRVLRRAFADLVQRVDQRLELVAELCEHAAEHALRSVAGRLRQGPVGAAAHRDVVVDVHRPAREAAGEEAGHEEGDVAEALQRADRWRSSGASAASASSRASGLSWERFSSGSNRASVCENIASRLTM